MLFGSDNGLYLAVPGKNCFRVNRLDGMEIDDCCADAFFFEKLRCLKGPRHHQAAGKEGHIGSLFQDDRLAGHKGSIFFRNNLRCGTGYTQIDRAVDLHRSEDRFAHLDLVTGDDDRHIRNAAHQGNILYRLMASAVLTHADAAVGKRKLDVELRIADGVAYHFKRSARAENRESAGKGDIARVRKAGSFTHHIGLRNAEIVKAVRIGIPEDTGLRGAGQVGIQDDDFIVDRAEVSECLAVSDSH